MASIQKRLEAIENGQRKADTQIANVMEHELHTTRTTDGPIDPPVQVRLREELDSTAQ